MIRKHTAKRLGAFLLGFLSIGGMFGCGTGLHQVHGTVVYKDGSDASVLKGGKVLFDPTDTDSPNRSSARGEIKEDGSFVMSSLSEGDGVVPGKYRVMLAPPPFFGKARGQAPPQLLDERYRSFATSGLEITVDRPVLNYTVTVQKP